jgi:hypothetical protein
MYIKEISAQAWAAKLDRMRRLNAAYERHDPKAVKKILKEMKEAPREKAVYTLGSIDRSPPPPSGKMID